MIGDRAVFVVSLACGIASCAAPPAADPERDIPVFGQFVRAPESGPVNVFVMFAPEAQIRRVCAIANHFRPGVAPPACLQPHVDPNRPPTLWVTAPKTWDDPYVCALGHEVLHQRKAEHR